LKVGEIMSLGKVTVWRMTEEERLAYIEKHPIVPTEKPKGTSLENVYEMQNAKARERKAQNRELGNRIMDSVDTKLLHELFMQGKTQKYIANELKITQSTLENYIWEQRKIEPEKWPYRRKGGS
jgi:DNA-directed RNA polymerase specialized sigma subunit